MPTDEKPDERRMTSAEHRTTGYRRRRPVIGAILIMFGVPATVAGYAMIVIHDGETMVLDGLPWFVLCFSGTIAFTLGFLMLRAGKRMPGFREGHAGPDPAVRRALLLCGLGAPLVGFGLSGILCARLLAAALGGAASGLLAWTIFIAGIVGVFVGGKMLVSEWPGLNPRGEAGRSAYHGRRPGSVPTLPLEGHDRTAGMVAAAFGLLALVAFSWGPRTYGLDGRNGWIALGLAVTFIAGLLMMIWPHDPQAGPAIYEARFSSGIAGGMAAIGTAMIPVVWMLALSGSADPNTRWSVAIVFLAFGIVLAVLGGRLLKDRRVVLRIDDLGLFWRKIGIVPWTDVVRARIRVGRRVSNVVVTVREHDGAELWFVVDLMGHDRTVGELAAALREREVRLGPET